VHLTTVSLSFTALLAAGFLSLGSGERVLGETAVAELKQRENRPWAACSLV